MRKMLLSAAGLFLLLPFYSHAQCDNNQAISAVQVDSDIKYGENINVDGDDQELFLDLYSPVGAGAGEKPLVILAHGGSFIGGSKDGDDVVPLANDLALAGFTVASIQYRLGVEGFPLAIDSSTASEAVIRGVHDMKAAIRFFRKSAQEGNPYNIDPDYVYAAGVSAGAFVALHLAYLDTEEEIPEYIDQTKPGLGGGLEGESGNPGFSSEVSAVVNIAGALRDKNWMTAGDEPLISFHGTEDGTVPYGSDMLVFLGFLEIFEVDGSKSIHDHAVEVGVPSCMETQYGQDHIPHVESEAYYDTLKVMTVNFLKGQYCDDEMVCQYGNPDGFSDLQAASDLFFFPNPSDGVIEFSRPISEVKIYNMMGVVVYEKKQNGFSAVHVPQLSQGVYLVQVPGENLTKKLMIRH